MGSTVISPVSAVIISEFMAWATNNSEITNMNNKKRERIALITQIVDSYEGNKKEANLSAASQTIK